MQLISTNPHSSLQDSLRPVYLKALATCGPLTDWELARVATLHGDFPGHDRERRDRLCRTELARFVGGRLTEITEEGRDSLGPELNELINSLARVSSNSSLFGWLSPFGIPSHLLTPLPLFWLPLTAKQVTDVEGTFLARDFSVEEWVARDTFSDWRGGRRLMPNPDVAAWSVGTYQDGREDTYKLVFVDTPLRQDQYFAAISGDGVTVRPAQP